MAVQATAVWRVRPSGNNLNGGGYDAGISGAATDYSQQNAAQATGTNGATTGAGATTFTDSTAAAFTSAMVGNCIQIASGTNFQAGFYFVTAFTNANSVVLDRSPSSGGAGSAGVWKLGGGWADPYANVKSTGPLVPGNTVYILGSGTPNPASYVYDYASTSSITPVAGNATAGYITFSNDPATPGYKAPPDTTGGMPTLRYGNGSGQTGYTNCGFNKFSGLWIVSNIGDAGITTDGLNPILVFGCVFDQFGNANNAMISLTGAVIGSEFFSSVSASHAFPAITANNETSIVGCNIHDTDGAGIQLTATGVVADTIIAKCKGYGILADQTGGNPRLNNLIKNCTIDANTGSGIEVGSQAGLSNLVAINNIISNHVTASTFGITVDAGTTAANDLVKQLIDYNSFYNNTTNYNAISAGPHDTALSVNPYVGQPTENYALA